MEIGSNLPLWSIIPFIGILLSIAFLPFICPKFWDRHSGKAIVSAFWSLLLLVPFLQSFRSLAMDSILETVIVDYVPFLILIVALYTIAGGIYLEGTLTGKPVTNLFMILTGTFLSSWIGTTGASMLMIRPILRANASRKHVAHTVVFFIFLAGNIGGSLTPLGDPPLFMGFIHGVPFFWTLRVLPSMLIAIFILSGIYLIWDSLLYKKEDVYPSPNNNAVKLRLQGAHNLLFLAGVIAAVLLSGELRMTKVNMLGVHQDLQNILRDGIIVAMLLLSIVTTDKRIRADNDYSWRPVLEVAILFFGIFLTMIPVLLILQAGEKGVLGVLTSKMSSPWHYFWISGVLSSFLDNTPTYLTFFNLTLGKLDMSETQLYEGLRGISSVISAGKISELTRFLVAVSAGSVFMGANTYIGNAPNFMIKSIAEEAGVKMPSFFGYIFKYSLPVLIPCFILITLMFFM